MQCTSYHNFLHKKISYLHALQGNGEMGARYLDPKYSRWISVDPALGEYVPAASKSSDGGKLPGMGGLFNTVNLNLFHYAGNNPVRYVDPDGFKFLDSSSSLEEEPNFWEFLEGIGFYALGGLIVIGTVAEDVATGGVGITDDSASFSFAWVLFAFGTQLINKYFNFKTYPSAKNSSSSSSPVLPNPDDDDERNKIAQSAKDSKQIKGNSTANDFAQKKGFEDAHDLKDYILNKHDDIVKDKIQAHYDIYYNSKTDEIFLRHKSTGIYIAE